MVMVAVLVVLMLMGGTADKAEEGGRGGGEVEVAEASGGRNWRVYLGKQMCVCETSGMEGRNRMRGHVCVGLESPWCVCVGGTWRRWGRTPMKKLDAMAGRRRRSRRGSHHGQ